MTAPTTLPPLMQELCTEHEILGLGPDRDMEEVLTDILGSHLHISEEALKEIREQLLFVLRDNNLLNQEEKVTTFVLTFSGEGDSGNYWNDCENPLVNRFLTLIGEEHIDFNWYDNDGGGGDITWDISTDTITINGYYNVVTQETAMEAQEV